ncbi:MAG: sensor histidine kinase [Lysobacter sp.]
MAEQWWPLSTNAGGEDASLMLLERLAHDLRGPLSPLQTAAYLLRRDDVEAERRVELLEIIERQTTRLSAMVQEVSDWTRARQSRLVEHRRPVGASLLVELGCAPAGPTVQLDLPETLDTAMVDGDAQRLVQMLSTLVGFMQAKVGDSGLSVRASMADNALGVVIEAPGVTWAEGERESLFKQAQVAPFDEGLGMRLLLAQAIARAHGGAVDVGETSADGACLHVRLPLAT